MNRVVAITLAIACAGALVMSIDPVFLQWLLVRAWVLALAVAPGAALVVACLGYGLRWSTPRPDKPATWPGGADRALRNVERVVLGFACGIGVVSSVVFLVGMFSLDPGFCLIVIGSGLVAGLLYVRDARQNAASAETMAVGPARSALDESGDMSPHSRVPAGFGGRVAWIIFAFAAALVALTALTPPLIFDVTEYHLGAWTSYFQGGEARFVAMPYNFYARFPFPIESIYFAGLALTSGIDTAPKFFNVACVFACAGLAWCFARRLGGGRTASALAALLALAHPVMLEVSIDALIDAPVALLVAASFYAGFTALGLFEPNNAAGSTSGIHQSEFDRSNRFPDPAASTPHYTFMAIFLFGVAIASKYTVAQLYLLPWVLLIFAPLAWQQIRNKPGRRALMWGCVAAAVPCVIWFGKNIAWYGNPLEPFFQHIFRPNDSAAIAREKFYIDSHFPQSPLSAQYWQTLLPRLHEFGWVILAACAGWIFIRDRRRAVLRFAGIVALSFLLWNTVRDSQNRFLLPLFVMLAAFAPVGVQGIPHRYGRGAIYAALILFASAATLRHSLRMHKSDVVTYLLEFAPSSRTTDFSDSAEPSPREEFIETNLGDLGEMVNYVNRTLPADARLLMIYEARPYLFRPDTEYNVVWDDSWLLDAIRPAENVDEAVEWLRHHGITHVLVNRQELLRYIQQYARREQLLRLGVGPGEDPRQAWTATEHPEDLYPPFYHDKDWERLRPIVRELLDRFDSAATFRRGAPTPDTSQTAGKAVKALDITLTELAGADSDNP